MSDKLNLEIIENDVELEKLCVDSVELIHYAKNIVVNHVNIVQIMTYYSLGRWEKSEQNMEVRLSRHCLKNYSKSLARDFQRKH